MSQLITHLESRLGRIQAGWTRDLGGRELPFQVAELRGGGQLEGSTSFSTIGLSEHGLSAGSGGEMHRMELVMTTHSALAPAHLPQSVQAVAKRLLARHAAILRGGTQPLPGPVAPGSQLSAVYAALPGYFDAQFDSVEIEGGSRVVIVWLIPIHASEQEFVDREGWPAFEQKMVDKDPDLLDLTRAPFC